MKITKAELINLGACKDGLNRFIGQTGGTEEAVNISDLVGGINTYADLIWLAGKKITPRRLVRFACDCALLHIEKIKPYTDKYDLILDFLRTPSAAARSVARYAAWAARTAMYAASINGDSMQKVNELLREMFNEIN